MKYFNTLTISLLFFFGTSCKKDLPNESQSGADTFGCYVNGKLFIPKGSPFAGPVLKAQYSSQNNKPVFSISATMADGENRHSVSIVGDSVKLAVGTYPIATPKAGGVSGHYNFPDPLSPQASYTSTTVLAGQLTIKHFDSIKYVVSGTFYFDALNSNGEKVEIREGRFDVKLY
jgi:hypothetical protein